MNPHVSVCMATYRGAPWIAEQLQSILDQLGPEDEVVIVDDASPDDTVERIRAMDDPRIRLIARDHNLGYVQTFQEALRAARGDLLLLADQDDVWSPERVVAMTRALHDVEVVATNLATLGGPDRIRGPYGQQDWHLRPGSSDHRLRNVLGVLIGNMPYYGCAMGLRRSALDTVLPFPGLLTESHDLWIALYGNLHRSMRHLDIRSVRRRFHDDNASPDRPRGPLMVLRSRWMLVRACVELLRRR
ncbi:glycosyltransferase [Cellulomonas sp. NPDC089187]|uniref:glycosyltransferase n=1 Tax=Cellulomonas sp. NPDC089187 TaxID=3154970 RepID=UPI003433C9BE